MVTPVAVGAALLLEGVGLGCVNLPDDKLLEVNVEEMIDRFLRDDSRDELTFNADLSKADRALVHVLAQKHSLGHKSQGKGDQRFITVRKRGARVHSADGVARINEAIAQAKAWYARANMLVAFKCFKRVYAAENTTGVVR